MNYHDIKQDDMLNGEGLRTTLFVSGCNHYCKGCHNKCTWDPKSGIPFNSKARKEIFNYLNESHISGFTLCGGDPLYKTNIPTLVKLVKDIRKQFPTKTIWMYTGSLWEDVKDIELVKLCDVVIDGLYVEELRDENYPYAGSTNQRVLDVKKSLEEGKPVLYNLED